MVSIEKRENVFNWFFGLGIIFFIVAVVTRMCKIWEDYSKDSNALSRRSVYLTLTWTSAELMLGFFLLVGAASIGLPSR